MSAKHTPGPWSWVDTSWECNHIYAARKLCATIHIDADVTEETEDACAKVMNANARLIAAAPELLDALSQLLVAVEYKGPASDFGRLGEENWCFEARVPVGFVDIARAAIAKATGEIA